MTVLLLETLKCKYENVQKMIGVLLNKNFFYRKVMVLALVYDVSSLNPIKSQSSQISLAKELFSKKYKVVENFEDCVFYQIDLNFCYKMVLNNEKI